MSGLASMEWSAQDVCEEEAESEQQCQPLFIPECQVFYESCKDSHTFYDGCRKNPKHSDFIPVYDFELSHLPADCRSQATMDFIKLMADRTVKVIVRRTSENRPDTYHDSRMKYPYSDLKGSNRATRCATGFIRYVIDPPIEGKDCPCHCCVQSNKSERKYWEVVVITATHVVYDNEEACKSVIECFYDSDDDKSEVKYLYGLRTSRSNDPFMNYLSDRCQVTCVTHDAQLVAKLRELQTKCRGKYDSLSLSCGLIISHPHGGVKKITMGKILHAQIPLTPTFPGGRPHWFGDGSKYRKPLANDNTAATADIASINNPKTSHSASDTSRGTTDFEFPLDLEDGSTFTVPKDSHYLCEVHRYEDRFWFAFPPKAKITLPDGNVLNVPPGTEFSCDRLNYHMKYECMYFMTYDVPTCPGSSGAEVIHYDSKYPRSFLNHLGALSDVSGTGRSSLNILFR